MINNDETVAIILKAPSKFYVVNVIPEDGKFVAEIQVSDDASKMSLKDLSYIKGAFAPIYYKYAINADDSVVLYFIFEGYTLDEIEDEMQRLVDEYLEVNYDD